MALALTDSKHDDSNFGEQNNQGDIIEQAIDPFKDPAPTEGVHQATTMKASKLGMTLVARLHILTSRLKGEIRRLCELAQSGQLSTGDPAHHRLDNTIHIPIARSIVSSLSYSYGSIYRVASCSTLLHFSNGSLPYIST
jgi:hypothetical protein